MAVAIWVGYWLNGSNRFSPHVFTNTENIQVTVGSVHQSREGFHVHCQITNQGQHTAAQIVLTARIVDDLGRDIAVNPLVAVSELAPGATRPLKIILPTRMAVSGHGYDAVVIPTVVRWDD